MARKKSQVLPAQPVKNDLIDQLEDYLSETVPYVADRVINGATIVLTQPPKETIEQAERYIRTTFPKVERQYEEIKKSSKKFLTSAYNNATKENLKKVASHAANFVKDHPYTATALGAGILAARYISPTVSVVSGLGLIGKVVYDQGEMNIGFDSDLGKIAVEARVGPKRRR